jgi:diguanylate cyclase (GGDEF)-like protein
MSSLAEIRHQLALAVAVTIIVAIGTDGDRYDYLMAFSYLTWCLFWYLVPMLRRLGLKLLKYPLIATDLLITGYMLTRTGGLKSGLTFFLFLPVFAAGVRCRLPGILVWATIMSVILASASYLTGTFNLPEVLIKATYLYLTGILGGFLIKRTYTVTEEISENLAQLNTRLQKLSSFSQEVSGSSDLDEIFNRIIKAAQQINPDLFVAVTLFDENGQLNIWDSSWQEEWLLAYESHPLQRHNLTLAPILVFREPLLCADINKHNELIRIFDGIPIRALFVFPIIVASEVAGALLISTDQNLLLPESEVQILNNIAGQAGVALQNIASLNEVKQQADTDGLTGLYNRRYFNEKIEELVDRAKEEGGYLSLIMMDVDNFKKYNDTFGHPAGDQLLKTVAGVVSDAVREGDIVARYGGEEFAVILKNSNRETALHIAERIRVSVANIPLGILKSPITLSLGVGTLPEHAWDRNSLLEFADQSLYYAKQSGKNKVSCGFKFKSSIQVKN